MLGRDVTLSVFWRFQTSGWVPVAKETGMRIRALNLTLAVLVCAAGCKKAAEEAMETAIESQIAKDGGSAKVEIGDDDMSFKFEDKTSGAKMAFGKSVEMPQDFPQDVPVYNPMTLSMAHSQEENKTFMVQGVTPDSVAKVAAFYAEETPKQGWSEETNMEQGEKMRAVVYKKESRSLNLVLAATEEGTSIMITTSQEQP
jgi:hypothetical protein